MQVCVRVSMYITLHLFGRPLLSKATLQKCISWS
uniref:Uncharacterized protein n=1 Tax=Anguilla anguilla TaxID=7936 RepID=A0A0E9R820_ANGAN